ncbi:sialate O-acetylesterase [Bacillus suaedae]|uniref:Sialate O-acetylesterase n=1 Tax=Halalkalibacter suaedae TaxID=2822140 RepID=A0A940WZC7_9BACI|nr:sialate O-acetylesterase [Bacillus suaedae]MBP3951540.1 sialate O-acetylesterase [Bacillus suaedae]
MILSSIISDGMVLQRNKKVTLSGNTTPFQQVEMSFLGKSYRTISDSNGVWKITLENLEAGGPHQMRISADEEILLQDILIGDVWVLGGQSNMELPISRTLDLFSEEMKAVNSPFIRKFHVPQNYDFHEPQHILTRGEWVAANQESVLEFSAVGYFFAKELYELYGVPIGLIHTAVGGTPAEAWISEKTLLELGGYENRLIQCKDDSYIATTKSADEERQTNWFNVLNEKDLGLKEAWFNKELAHSSAWSEFQLPNSWHGSELEAIRGSVWFRKEFELPALMTDCEAKLAMGTIIDADETYINGILIGSTGYMYPPRRYSIPSGLLKPGRNSIAVRVMTTQNTGSFIKEMPYKLFANDQELDLSGTWHYRIGAMMKQLEPATFFQYEPAGLYNGMIAPLNHYQVKGVLWYQGESNTHTPEGYRTLFRNVVKDWRANWDNSEFPFIYTQLANFDTGAKDTENNNWAVLREEQRKSLTLPNTAMAVTIDIGESNDLHPQNKKTLGQRLALSARKLAYNDDIIYSGPLYQKMERIGSSIHLHFDHVGGGLTARNGALQCFMISGKDGRFVPATASIHGPTVVVYHEQINEPCHVRYAWEDNPVEANLYNKEGLPASPFSTETGQ